MRSQTTPYLWKSRLPKRAWSIHLDHRVCSRLEYKAGCPTDGARPRVDAPEFVVRGEALDKVSGGQKVGGEAFPSSKVLLPRGRLSESKLLD